LASSGTQISFFESFRKKKNNWMLAVKLMMLDRFFIWRLSMKHEGKKLREFRESHGLKQVAVAIEARISPSRLCLIERWVKPSAEESQRVREAIDRLSQDG
jgi:hypothetical protein